MEGLVRNYRRQGNKPPSVVYDIASSSLSEKAPVCWLYPSVRSVRSAPLGGSGGGHGCDGAWMVEPAHNSAKVAAARNPCQGGIFHRGQEPASCQCGIGGGPARWDRR
ncbi:hypothetical protein ANO11243_008910 [Dothideomycetidae sp. 11243]|nr:hypothetical protein ANO11243_008910 [fungal sp. No.11243]